MSAEAPLEPRIGAAPEKQERNWLPFGIAVGVVVVLLVVVLLAGGHRKVGGITPADAPLDAYASSLPISHIVMSESGNLAGSKVTYVDGHIANRGGQTVTGVTVQVIFHSYTQGIAQNETVPLNLIRTREPYVDIESVGAAPLHPGDEHDFRLIFEKVSPDWDGAYPVIRVLRVDTK